MAFFLVFRVRSKAADGGQWAQSRGLFLRYGGSLPTPNGLF